MTRTVDKAATREGRPCPDRLEYWERRPIVLWFLLVAFAATAVGIALGRLPLSPSALCSPSPPAV